MLWSIFLLFLPLLLTNGIELPKRQDYPINMRDGRCDFNEFDCFPENPVPFCLPFDVVRDCIPDCENGEDEKCGFNQTLCDVNVKKSNSMCGKCVNNSELDRFCVDRKWKNLCFEENVRQCATNSNCVHESWLNDGEDVKCPTKNCNNSNRPLIGHLKNKPDYQLHHREHQNYAQASKESEFPCDCSELMRKNPKENSTKPQKAYDPRCYRAGECSFPILCNFELFGGGWTVLMHRRWPPQIHFNRTWIDYKMGFGSMQSEQEFWLGNDRIHSLTFGRKCPNELVIQMRTSKQGSLLMARYESILVGDESDAYKLTLGPLLVENPLFTAIDGLITARDRPFVTWDRQQHFCPKNSGGFWLPPDNCGQMSLTSNLQAYRGHSGLIWGSERLIEVTMLIRPKLYTAPIASNS